MSASGKRIEAGFPEESFELIASASERMGLTLRGFACMAIYQTAVSVLKTEFELPLRHQLHLSEDELENLAKLLSDPYRNANRIVEAHKRVSAIPHRYVSEEELCDGK